MVNAFVISERVSSQATRCYLPSDFYVDNSESLEVSYLHLSDSKSIIAHFLLNCPSAMLAIFDEVALGAILLYYPAYERIHSEVHVRMADLPVTVSLRDLRRADLNTLVRVSGVVTRRTGVFPQLKYVKFDCRKCGAVLGPFYQDSTREVKISYCPNCEGRGPFAVNSEQVCFDPNIRERILTAHRPCTETTRKSRCRSLLGQYPQVVSPGTVKSCSCGISLTRPNQERRS